MIGKLAKTLSAVGLTALITFPVVLYGQTPPPVEDATTPRSALQPASGDAAPKAKGSGSDERDAMILSRQGLMEGIYQYVEDAEDWTEQSPGAGDGATLHALTREAAHMALMLPAFKQLFPPSTNPASQEFSSTFDTYALPAIWAEPDLFATRLDATVAAINVLAMARERSEYAQRLQALQATCDACHDRFRRVYVSPFDTK